MLGRVRTTLVLGGLVCCIAWNAISAAVDKRSEIENVAAFARLYGVVRYFYPSDTAASLDWNRFAVEGVRRIRSARTNRELSTDLNALFQPLGPAIEIRSSNLPAQKLPPAATSPDSNLTLIAWRYLGIPFGWPNAMAVFGMKRTHVSTIRGMVMMTQSLPAADLRGRPIRLSGKIRARRHDGSAAGALSLDVSRGEHGAGLFASVRIQPMQVAEWRDYTFEGAVDQDATGITISLIASGAMTADFDALQLSVRHGLDEWRSVPIQDPGFEAPNNSPRPAWTRVDRPGPAEVTRPAGNAPEGSQFLRITPLASASDSELFDDARPVRGDHLDFALGAGLRARVPLVLTGSEAQHHPGRRPLDTPLRDGLFSRDTLDARLADVVVAWNAFRHFYSYWAEAGVDWETRLYPRLNDAYDAQSRVAQEDVLRLLVADARDGHGRVIDTSSESFVCPICPLHRDGNGVLPVLFGVVEGRIVILASNVPAEAPVGSVVSSINGVSAVKLLDTAVSFVSGSPQWRTARALQEIGVCAKDMVVKAVVDAGSGAREIGLRCGGELPPGEERPATIAELKSGLWYVDLTRARMADIRPALNRLANAESIIFDMRGYPTDAGSGIIPYLLKSSSADRSLHIAKIARPFGQFAGWKDLDYEWKPAEPHLSAKAIFLTDARAISAGDGVMVQVRDLKLATILGGKTAGTNGNVVTFGVPDGFDIKFTGLHVTRDDGRTRLHLVGTEPDITVAPTISGLRGGRDEVLERAMELVSH